jgi:hypothetical protein
VRADRRELDYAVSAAGGVIQGSELVSDCAGYAPPDFAMWWVAEDAPSHCRTI